MKKLVFAFFAGLFLMAGITGCHTVKGAGEDIENAGEELQDATK